MGINKDLGLPFGDGMEKIAICFDVDGTLIDEKFVEFEMFTTLLMVLANARWKNVKIIVWSGGGSKYAETQSRALGIEKYVHRFMSKLQHQELRDAGYKIIAIDDVQDTRLGDVNLIVRNK